jgi:Asp-tRNA(Asn)/Glu-tRNA(Gln) amidotransferase A subunit family amidase
MALGWTYDRLGPMCRYAEDCAMVMSLVAKPDGRDMSISDLPFNWNPSMYELKKMRIGVAGLKGPISPTAQKFMDVLKGQGATFVEYTPPDVADLPRYPAGYNYEQGAFFDEFVRGGGVERMTRPARGADFKSARLMNVVDFLQGERIRMMAMTRLAKATAGLDAYFSATPAPPRGGAGRGAAGAAGARGGAPAAAGAAGAAARGGRGGGGGAPGGGTGDTNSAGHPGLNIVVSFSEPAENAPAGMPQSVVLYAPPFKETELCFIGKCFQDVAQMHTKKPILKG